MPEILTDVEFLHQPSQRANDLEVGEIVQQLSISIPNPSLGLSAPQIGIQKRVFLANLSSGSFVFVNPTLIWKSSDKVPSEEGCLSLPGIARCVERHSQVHIFCDKLINIKTNELEVDAEIRLKNQDALIVQHETDHLDGILLIDHEQTKTSWKRQLDAQEDRRKRIEAGRLKKQLKAKSTPKKVQKISKKKATRLKTEENKLRRQLKAERSQNKIRVEIEERRKMEKEGIITESKTSTEDAKNPE